MIHEISYPTKVDALGIGIKKKKTNSANGTLPVQSSAPVVNYSLGNLKANFVSFTGNGRLNDSSQLAGSQGEMESGVYAIKRIKKSVYEPENLMNLRDREFVDGNYYSGVADDVMISLGKDKNVLMPYEESVTPEILTHGFAKNVKAGKYRNFGLMPHNTDVFVLNTRDIPYEVSVLEGQEVTRNDQIKAYRNAVMQTIEDSSRKKPLNKQIFFVKDFEEFLASFAGAKDYEVIFDRQSFETRFPNTRIVGMVPQSEMKLKTAEDIMRGNTPKFDPQRLKFVRKVELNGLGANDTKKLLKSDVQFLKKVLNGYDMARFDITSNAIDKIVDKTAYQYAGAFPNKAMNVMDLIAATMVTESKKGDGEQEVKLKISSDVVDKFFDNHSDLLKPIKLDESVFSFAQKVTTKFSDVGGVSDAKEEMQKIVDFAKDPKKYLKKFPMMSAPKGIIMEGPSGTGKTLLAMAVAGEVDVPFSSMSASELLKKYIGEGEEAVREWFKKLDQAATDSGKGIAVGFIDEIDAIGTTRSTSDAGSEAKSSILNQLLTLLDGFNNKNAKNKIIILAATNRADVLDPALKRGGRFDRVVLVDHSNTIKETLEVLNIHTKNLPFESEASKTKVLGEMAKLLKGSSGSDIKKVIDITKEVVSLRPENRVVTYNDMFEGLLQAMSGKKKVSETPLEQKRLVTIHEAGHALVRDFFNMPLAAVSNEERGIFGGVTISPLTGENPNFISLIKELAAKSAGGDAEALYIPYGHDAGVSQDLKQATAMIDSAIKKWGLGVFTPQINLAENESLEKLYEKEIKKDIELFLSTRKTVSEKIMSFYKSFLDEVYLKRYDEEMASGKGGNVYSGEQFREMRESWLDASGKRAEFDALQAETSKLIQDAQKANKQAVKLAEDAVEQVAKKVSHFKPVAFGAMGAIALGGIIYAGISKGHKEKQSTAQSKQISA